jgi:2,5-diketo-D-gluconate reductase A
MDRSVKLNDGKAMPRVGLGTWQMSNTQVEKALLAALEAGYRAVDTAKTYNNERGVGKALAASGLPRADIFVTTKLAKSDHAYEDALRAFDRNLRQLGLDYVDLYLIHWPAPRQDKYLDAWRALMKIGSEGRARSIGVSNFTVRDLTRVIDAYGVVPVVNQIELHPRFAQGELRAFHAQHGIVTEAWSPLGQGGGLLTDATLRRVADKHGKTAAQVALRWSLQLGNVVIPKSVTPARIAENLDLFGFELDDEDIGALSTLDGERRLGPDPAHFG